MLYFCFFSFSARFHQFLEVIFDCFPRPEKRMGFSPFPSSDCRFIMIIEVPFAYLFPFLRDFACSPGDGPHCSPPFLSSPPLFSLLNRAGKRPLEVGRASRTMRVLPLSSLLCNQSPPPPSFFWLSGFAALCLAPL